MGPLARRDFRLFWTGESLSTFGDQLYFLALPWLTLALGGSATTIGAVLATSAVPRALLMLHGGDLVDRLTPRRAIAITNAVRALTFGVLACVVALHEPALWQLYVLALVCGMCDALSYPAFPAMLPRLLAPSELRTGNALMHGANNVAAIAGPLLASLVLTTLGASAAFGLDALTFVVGLITVLALRGRGPRATSSRPRSTPAASVRAGVLEVIRDPKLRPILVTLTTVTCAQIGVTRVVLPAAASSSPELLGLGLTATAVGALLGLVLGARLSTPPTARLLAGLAAAVILLGLGLEQGTSGASLAALMLVIGALASWAQVTMLSEIQACVPTTSLGRVMGVTMWALHGLAPLSLPLVGSLAAQSIGLPCLFSALLLGAGLVHSLLEDNLAARRLELLELVEDAGASLSGRLAVRTAF